MAIELGSIRLRLEALVDFNEEKDSFKSINFNLKNSKQASSGPIDKSVKVNIRDVFDLTIDQSEGDTAKCSVIINKQENIDDIGFINDALRDGKDILMEVYREGSGQNGVRGRGYHGEVLFSGLLGSYKSVVFDRAESICIYGVSFQEKLKRDMQNNIMYLPNTSYIESLSDYLETHIFYNSRPTVDTKYEPAPKKSGVCELKYDVSSNVFPYELETLRNKNIFVQNGETHWQFLKRVCGKLALNLFVDVNNFNQVFLNPSLNTVKFKKDKLLSFKSIYEFGIGSSLSETGASSSDNDSSSLEAEMEDVKNEFRFNRKENKEVVSHTFASVGLSASIMVKNVIANGLTGASRGIADNFTGMIPGDIAGTVGGVTNSLSGAAGGLLNNVSGAAGGLLNNVSGAAGGLLNNVSGSAGGLVDSIVGSATDSVKGIAGSAMDGVKNSVPGISGSLDSSKLSMSDSDVGYTVTGRYCIVGAHSYIREGMLETRYNLKDISQIGYSLEENHNISGLVCEAVADIRNSSEIYVDFDLHGALNEAPSKQLKKVPYFPGSSQYFSSPERGTHMYVQHRENDEDSIIGIGSKVSVHCNSDRLGFINSYAEYKDKGGYLVGDSGMILSSFSSFGDQVAETSGNSRLPDEEAEGGRGSCILMKEVDNKAVCEVYSTHMLNLISDGDISISAKDIEIETEKIFINQGEVKEDSLISKLKNSLENKDSDRVWNTLGNIVNDVGAPPRPDAPANPGGSNDEPNVPPPGGNMDDQTSETNATAFNTDDYDEYSDDLDGNYFTLEEIGLAPEKFEYVQPPIANPGMLNDEEFYPNNNSPFAGSLASKMSSRGGKPFERFDNDGVKDIYAVVDYTNKRTASDPIQPPSRRKSIVVEESPELPNRGSQAFLDPDGSPILASRKPIADVSPPSSPSLSRRGSKGPPELPARNPQQPPALPARDPQQPPALPARNPQQPPALPARNPQQPPVPPHGRKKGGKAKSKTNYVVED